MSKGGKISKTELRQRMKKRLAAMSEEERREGSRVIGEKVWRVVREMGVEIVCCYVAMKGEVETRGLIGRWLEEGLRVVVPEMGVKNFESGMKLVEVGQVQEDGVVETGRDVEADGIRRERDGSIDPAQVDVFIVPGLAFDERGYRLGRGGGYYDRLLAQVRVLKIGLAYGCQMVEELVHLEHDVRMDRVISDKRKGISKR